MAHAVSGGPLSLLLLAAGTGVGMLCQRMSFARAERLSAWHTAFQSIRLLLGEARVGMGGVLAQAADTLPAGQPAVRERLSTCAQALLHDPRLSVGEAYEQACRLHPALGESAAERSVLQTAFRLMGCGTAAMREQAAGTCAQRLRALLSPAEEAARQRGRLYGRLGALGGAALAILFW